MKKFTLTALAAGMLMSSTALIAPAQAGWKPDGPVVIQPGFSAGSTVGISARAIAKAMQEQTGWKTVVEPKPGGGGIAMMIGLTKKPANGRTIGLGVNVPFLLNMVFKGDELPINVDSFNYVGTFIQAPIAIMVKGDSPYNTLREFIEASKTKDLKIGTFGPAVKIRTNAIKNKEKAGFKIVSYKSSSEIPAAIMGGHIDAGWSAGKHLDYLGTDKIKIIAAMTTQRQPRTPDVSTATEQGMGYGEFDTLYFAVTHKDTPSDAQKALNKAFANALKHPDVIKVIKNISGGMPVNKGEGTKSLFAKDRKAAEELVKLAK